MNRGCTPVLHRSAGAVQVLSEDVLACHVAKQGLGFSSVGGVLSSRGQVQLIGTLLRFYNLGKKAGN